MAETWSERNTIMTYGKSIELFLVNGTADSLTIAELSNWNGKAIRIPRIEVASCRRSDITQAGVYFLFCRDEIDDSDSVYIGEAENVKERLLQHIRDYQTEKEKYYWNTAIAFIGRDLNKAHIRYLENRLVEIARECNRYTVLTKNTYKNTMLKESQIAAMEEFIDNIKILINTLGYKVLEPFIQKVSNEDIIDSDLLYISIGSAMATGMITTEGFVVLKGSTINEKTSAKSLSAGMAKLRSKHMASNAVDGFVTVENILFSSASAAADFVLGYSVSGPRTWKTKEGRSLKEIEDNQSDTQIKPE